MWKILLAHLIELVHERHDVGRHPLGTVDDPEGGRDHRCELDAARGERQWRAVRHVLPNGPVSVGRHGADQLELGFYGRGRVRQEERLQLQGHGHRRGSAAAGTVVAAHAADGDRLYRGHGLHRRRCQGR